MSATRTKSAIIADAVAKLRSLDPDLADELEAIRKAGPSADPDHYSRLAVLWETINAKVAAGHDARNVVTTLAKDREFDSQKLWNVWKVKDDGLRAELRRRSWNLTKPRGQEFCQKLIAGEF